MMWEKLVVTFAGFIWRELGVAAVIFLVLFLLRDVIVENCFKPLWPLLRRTGLEPDTGLQESLKKPLRYLVIILAVYLFFAVLPLNAEQNFLLVKFVRAAVVIVIAWKLYELADIYPFDQLSRKIDFKIDRILIPLLKNFTKVLIVALTVSMIAQEWGYNVSGFVAGLGLGGLAIALAAKDALSNIFGGIIIVTDKP